jgi:hypothetical protein
MNEKLTKFIEFWKKKLGIIVKLKIVYFDETLLNGKSIGGVLAFKNGRICLGTEEELSKIFIEKDYDEIHITLHPNQTLEVKKETILHELLHVKYPEYLWDNVWTNNKVKELLGRDKLESDKVLKKLMEDD